MPHQCVRCGKNINDGSRELLEGCKECGGKFFFYVKSQEMEGMIVKNNLSSNDIDEMEKDVRELLDEKKKGKPIILDLETIKTMGPGKFKIDVSALMRGEPIVINISDGKYFIDISSAFKKGNSEILSQLK